MRTILYISYDGLTDPLGQSQILPYLKRLGALGNKFVIVSFEKPDRLEAFGAELRSITEKHQLTWIPLRYTKWPPILSTVYDIRKAIDTCKSLHRQYNFQIVHCRGYIPALVGKWMKEKYGLRFIFDMRGWWPDEKKESGFWNKRIYLPVYHYFKKLEQSFFKTSDLIVSLTFKGKEYIEMKGMASTEKIGVIPTCVDFEIFPPWNKETRSTVRTELGIAEDEKVFIYSGSLGGNYDPNTLIRVYKAFQSVYSKNFLLILSKDPAGDNVAGKFQANGINRMTILSAPFTAVGQYLQASDVGFIYYQPTFSTIGRSPTKLGEYWACGLPVISFKNIGDLDVIFERYAQSGILLSAEERQWPDEIKQLVFADKDRLRSYAEDYFHIDKGVIFYQNIYERLSPVSIEATVNVDAQ